ncbi:protein FAM13A isoform X1 [Drosophila albomicans]|uniref:Protein FAM13A isoform X1 n=2 Tax=Drosophila albomicans TaxID=7291 RepID=A0A6P8XAK6_DROAB|nr:protein FAM13A isoform X1 [Drosophila albomicans]
MTPKIITYFLCGMRHPTTGLNEDDLSRLTGSSSSSTASCGSAASSSSSSSAAATQRQQDPCDVVQLSSHQTDQQTSPRFNSTYLPEIINPLEWQKSRKRKERLDSCSATSQDRKLQRSNSEELLTEPEAPLNPANPTQTHCRQTHCEVIRRVSSEDFKRTASYASYCQEIERDSGVDLPPDSSEQQENNAALANLPQSVNIEATKDRARLDTSPARSQQHSPVRNGRQQQMQREASDDSECEHERRRSSERFCKSRQPPVRKSGVSKKPSAGGKYLPSRRDEQSAYKYDLSALKYERRGFISSKKQQQQQQQQTTVATLADHNDNNLIDFHQQQQQQQLQQQQQQTKRSASISPTPTTSSSCSSAGSDDSTPNATSAPIKAKPPQRQQQTLNLTSAQESLPWVRGDEPAPMLSRRYAHSRHHAGGNIDAAAKLAKVMPYPQQQPKQAASVQLLSEDMDCLEPMDAVRAFSSLENMRTRDVMQQVVPAMMAFQTPEERVKAINRRVTALKKKLVQLEDSLEQRLGYRPSQAERLNDKYMKNALAELSKLRKERHELKTDPIAALGLKVGANVGGQGSGIAASHQDAAKKLERMKNTLCEIEQNLSEKRTQCRRPQQLEELTSDQLVQEKTAVQHGLLYFESLYGHPITKEERDAARSLYDRYRQLKRLVSRSIMFGGGSGVPELPTILEHEAMVFEATSTPLQYSSNNSTETTNSPSDSMAPNSTLNTQNASSDESTTTTTTTTTATEHTQAENIAALSLDQLWEQLERVRDEKTLLKATIREYESIFEEQNGRKMLKPDRKSLETETYAQYKEKKAKVRLLQALIKKHIGH